MSIKDPHPSLPAVHCKVAYSLKASSNAGPVRATLTHPSPSGALFINQAQPGTLPKEKQKQNIYVGVVSAQSLGTYCLSLTLCSDV